MRHVDEEAHGELALRLQPGPDVDDEELLDLTSRLRQELLTLDVDEVSVPAVGEAPADAKGLKLLAIGGVVVKFLMRSDVLQAIVATTRSWLARQQVRSVELSIDGDTCKVTGITSDDQDRLIDLWIARHAQSE